jgi:hypothetical protein
VFAHPHLWLCIYPTPGGAALVLDCSDAVSVLTRGESSSTGFCCDVEMDDLKSFVVDCAADARKCVPSLAPFTLPPSVLKRVWCDSDSGWEMSSRRRFTTHAQSL